MIALCIIVPLILLAAMGAVWKARPVHAALLLALSLSLVAVLYITIGIDFIGLVQFAVYVGAIAVLIVFSLLITRPGDEAEELDRRPQSMIPGLFCTLPVLGVLVYSVMLGTMEVETTSTEPEVPAVSLQKMGEVLFTTHAPAVIAIAVLLTAVMIGAALFAREPQKKQPTSSDS
ncbi:MAG: NADH-quinone oxidoreductase subunit J [Akkermansiaceae bacterium]|nr:NADH-quinone oxidoreductase subunit J [Akkermansiaceae bacterium]